MSPAKSHKAAAIGVDPGKGVGPLPGRIEGRDAAAAAAGNAAVVAARRQLEVELLGHKRQQFLHEEADVGVVDGIVLETAVAASHRAGQWRRQLSRTDEYAHGNGHVARGDQRLQHPFLRRVIAILPNIDACRLGGIILGRDEHAPPRLVPGKGRL